MVSSLAEQLAKGASLNANVLSEKTRKQSASESYLFSPKEARQHDLDSLYALGHNGFLQLQSLQPELADFEDSLFSEYARTLDRALQPTEQNNQLDETIAAFLPLLGPFLLDAPTGKVLEWLVRRFRIHEFNVVPIISLFLPYHETPHFTKMLSILRLSDNSPLRFLQAYKTTVTTLHRNLLINEMATKPEVARLVSNILPTVLKDHSAGMHRALIAFHTGTLLEYVTRSKTLDENTMLLLLPAAMEPLQAASTEVVQVKRALLQESVLGSFLILAVISQKVHLTSKAIKSMSAAAVECAGRVTPKQLVRTLVSICAPQDPLEKLHGKIVKALLAIPGIDTELTGTLVWVGADKLLCPFMDNLLSRIDDPIALSTAESILTSPDLLPSVARSAASTLIRQLVGESTVERPSVLLSLRQLLSQLHQRHPKAVQAASQTIIEEGGGDNDVIEQLILSLSVSVGGSSTVDTETATLAVASTGDDANVRAKAVRDLVLRLSLSDIPEMESHSISSTLLLRVYDTSASVLQALYNTSAEAITHAFLAHAPSPTAYLDALKQALHGSGAKPSRDVIRTHLSFLLSHFLPAAASLSAGGEQDEGESDSEDNRERTRRAFMDILLPFLLFSKPRMKTAQTVWEILETAEGSEGAVFELLGGCVEAVRWEQARLGAGSDGTKSKDGDKEGMDANLTTKINVAVAAKVADNILASNYFNAHLELLLEKLHSESTHARALAYLVTRALLNRLSGEQRVEAGHKVLSAMKLETLEGMGDFMRGVEDVGTFLDDTSVGTTIVLKPNSQNTLHRLQIAVLSVLPNFPRPTGASLDWISEHYPDEAAPNVRAARYIQLLRSVYRLSNSSASLPLLSTHLLRTLFIKLGEDALAFLAGIWLTAAAQTRGYHGAGNGSEAHIQYAALRHAGAFLEAHIVTERMVDFQTVVPAILVMLQSADTSVREAAVRCIAVVIRLSFAKDAEGVYAFDAIYGGGASAKLQYLDWADFQKYMKAIGEIRDNLLHDPEYLSAFHREHLVQSKGDSKKTAGYKQRVLYYLLSHVNACPLLNVKAALLKCVDAVTNEAKAQVLMPTIELLLGQGGHGNGNVEVAKYQELVTLAVSTFDHSAVAELNEATWDAYENVLTTCLKNAQWESARTALLYRLQHGLSAKLSMDRKIQLCQTLVRLGAEDESLALICKTVLTGILNDVTLVIRLLIAIRPQRGPDSAAQPASKRPRTEKSHLATSGQDLSPLAILAEVVGSLKIAGSLELVSCLLETLNKVANHTSPDVADRRFVEQLLMSAIENVVQNVPSTTPVAPGSIRLDTLVEIIRTSENPQTFHQACLLMASLAHVAPDAVLHNVMPIFTFMGSNVFHRDDTYSFRVVQKTIDSIVPVMVASLKEAHGSETDLYIASREFLHVFTNAANHVPRHRRVNFFSHLVDTLGPAEFLAPVAMLLVDRKSSRVVRQNATEAGASLFLPLAVCERYAAELQLSAFVHLIHEVRRQLNGTDKLSEPPFLEDLPDDEHTDVTTRRRAGALLVFCNHALKRLRTFALAYSEKERAISRELLTLLLAVATARPEDASYSELAAAARSVVASALGIMPALDFVAGIYTIIGSSSVHAQAGALELLGERLAEVNESARRTLTPSIVKIVEATRDMLSGRQDTSLARSALQALATISNTLAPGEEGAVTESVLLVLGCLKQDVLRVPAMQTLLAFSSKLGPRVIPFLKEIVKECINRSREALSGGSDAKDLVPISLNVLRNLLTSIPTFWGELEVLQVIELYLDSSQLPAGDSTEMSLMIKTVSKRTSPSVLLPAICHMWTQKLSGGAQHLERTVSFMRVVKASAKAASRTAVLENIRELVKTFLSMFDYAAQRGDNEVENTVIGAFVEVVVKLNETAFRPIFRKMFDWAFTEDSANRKIMFCHVYSILLDFFKVLMVPYMSFAWQAFQEELKTSKSKNQNPEEGQLWLAVLQTLSKSMSADEDRVFWRSDKLRQLVPLAIQQIPAAVHLNVAEGKTAVSGCLTALLGLTDDDVIAKSLNLDVLMYTRSDDARIRLFSLSCAEQLWRAHGDKLLGFVAETATFIAEAAEDENDRVVQEAHKLKAAVEAIGGSIDVL